jgi:CRISPR-associated protein Csx3
LWQHCDRVIAHVESRFVAGTTLVNYGDGDWDDTLQPADPAMRTRMISAWTVGLAYHTLRQLAELCRRCHEEERGARLATTMQRMRTDFARLLQPGGVVAGFMVAEPNGTLRPLLHPEDNVTGIRYRLLPMTRSILAELFTRDEARRHLELIEAHLQYPDGVRLMSEPATYHGGLEQLFRRAETAANVGREIGLQYVHAHLRYAEALAKVGDGERLWRALQTVNPVGLQRVVPNAAARQSNVYFSSSDADFPDRYAATERWPELRSGSIAVRGGWRLYSSGPGLFLHKVRTCLLGVRECYGDVVFDPVLPRSLDGLKAELEVCGVPVRLIVRVRHASAGPAAVIVNGTGVQAGREQNPYRTGGLLVDGATLRSVLRPTENVIEVEL